MFHDLSPGLQCEAEIDECLSDPCSAEGTEKCIDLDNKFLCQCHPGYKGQFCEVRYFTSELDLLCILRKVNIVQKIEFQTEGTNIFYHLKATKPKKKAYF